MNCIMASVPSNVFSLLVISWSLLHSCNFAIFRKKDLYLTSPPTIKICYPCISTDGQTSSFVLLLHHKITVQLKYKTLVHIWTFLTWTFLSVMSRREYWVLLNVLSYSLICTVTPCLEHTPPLLCLVSLTSDLMMNLIHPWGETG